MSKLVLSISNLDNPLGRCWPSADYRDWQSYFSFNTCHGRKIIPKHGRDSLEVIGQNDYFLILYSNNSIYFMEGKRKPLCTWWLQWFRCSVRAEQALRVPSGSANPHLFLCKQDLQLSDCSSLKVASKEAKSNVQRRLKQTGACLRELFLLLGAALPLPSCSTTKRNAL